MILSWHGSICCSFPFLSFCIRENLFLLLFCRFKNTFVKNDSKRVFKIILYQYHKIYLLQMLGKRGKTHAKTDSKASCCMMTWGFRSCRNFMDFEYTITLFNSWYWFKFHIDQENNIGNIRFWRYFSFDSGHKYVSKNSIENGVDISFILTIPICLIFLLILSNFWFSCYLIKFEP